ncbi:DUF938 domain-containing protein [Hyphomonas pacifica]|uniref:DUF938 domain-containing protein n=1 Tax=Hyphomonas pacifica TaxID=1280941 RepID=UPI000DC00389|nr:DUF938 domain-containing protein [Hyphomonas pacifica]RAN35908.1 hypothetical protein HY11_13075 [Hyphomonas pacifica]
MSDDSDKTFQKTNDGKPVAMEARDQAEDGRRYSPSVARNREPILEVFREHVGETGQVLEIASGTGEHGAFLTEALPQLNWTYSDIDTVSRESQAAWRRAALHERLHGPYTVDASAHSWGPVEYPGHWDVIVSMNMIHIAPFEVALGLIGGAGRLLKPKGKLFLYGPFARHGEIAPSNAEFSANLKSRDPRWGVRDLDQQIVPLAEEVGLRLQQVIEMPANNLSVVLQRQA